MADNWHATDLDVNEANTFKAALSRLGLEFKPSADGELTHIEYKATDDELAELVAILAAPAETALCAKLSAHTGHNVTIVGYNGTPPTLECETCGCVVLDSELYDIHAREDQK